jgi:hypothetical protein
MSNQELTNTLFDAMGFGVYRGVILQRLIGGYKVFGKVVRTKKEVDEAIDSALKNLGKSIQKSNERPV